MRKRLSFASFFLSFFLALAVTHLFVQLVFLEKGGISGRAIEGSNSLSSEIWSKISSTTSTIILFAEWGLIFLGVVFVYVKHKVDLKKELHDLKNLKENKHFGKGTELDNFYELLRETKHFRLSTASIVFGVDEEIAEEWAKTLENQKLATLTYPRIGGPEIMLNEKGKTENEGNK